MNREELGSRMRWNSGVSTAAEDGWGRVVGGIVNAFIN